MGAEGYRILLAIDLKPGTDHLLVEAERFALAMSATVDILHVAQSDPEFVGYIKGSIGEATPIDVEREFKSDMLRDEHRRVHSFATALRKKGVRVDQVVNVQGRLPAALFEHVKKFGCDLLVLGAHQHGAVYRFWYGDIATDAVMQMPCSLLLVQV